MHITKTKRPEIIKSYAMPGSKRRKMMDQEKLNFSISSTNNVIGYST